MDFLKQFDARAAAEDLIEMEVRNQATGDVIKNGGKPCIVLVRSNMSAEILAEDRAAKNAAMKEVFRRARAKKKDAEAADDEDVDFDWNEIEAKINARAVKLIAGFKNIQTAGDDGQRDLTADDAEAFVALNRISEDHHWRNVIPLNQNEDETDEAFEARKAKIEAEWLGASFAQQVIDAAREHADFLAKRGKS